MYSGRSFVDNVVHRVTNSGVYCGVFLCRLTDVVAPLVRPALTDVGPHNYPRPFRGCEPSP